MNTVFDLDGTLADGAHRLHHIQKSPKDWDSFFKDCVDDKPIEPMRALYNELARRNHLVAIWTGRSVAVYNETCEWLSKHRFFVSTSIRMRPEGVFTLRHRTQGDMAQGIQRRDRTRTIDLVFEDRKRVIDMWRRNGVVACQVAEGDF